MLAQFPYEQIYTTLRLFCSLHDSRTLFAKRSVRITSENGKLYLGYAAKDTTIRVLVRNGKIEQAGSFESPLRPLKRTLEFWPERLVTALGDDETGKVFLVEEAGDRLRVPTLKDSTELSSALQRLGEPGTLALPQNCRSAELAIAELLEIISLCHYHESRLLRSHRRVGLTVQNNRLLGFYEYSHGRVEFCGHKKTVSSVGPRFWKKPTDIDFRATYRLGDLSKICRLIINFKIPTSSKVIIWQTKTGLLELYIPNLLQASIRGEPLSEICQYLGLARQLPFDEYRIPCPRQFEELNTYYDALSYRNMTNANVRARYSWFANAYFSDEGLRLDPLSTQYPDTGITYKPYKLAAKTNRRIKVEVPVLLLMSKLFYLDKKTTPINPEIRIFAHRGDTPQIEIQFENRRLLLVGTVQSDVQVTN